MWQRDSPWFWLGLWAALATGFQPTRAEAAAASLVAWTDEGLHETDGSDVSVYALFPPYSTFHAQLMIGGKLVTNDTDLVVTYEALADPSGSINSTSQGKGNFGSHAQDLFGVDLAEDEGLAGFFMPGSDNMPQPMIFDAERRCFSAIGVPLTPYDDAGQRNAFPMLRLIASWSSGEIVAEADLVLPVSDEKNCRACHSSGSNPAGRPHAGWAWDADVERDYKLNILRNHDDHYLGNATYSNALSQAGYCADGLYVNVTRLARPVLCLRCHVSNALPGSGLGDIRPLTQVMHNKHAFVADPRTGTPLSQLSGSGVCLNCHAGPESRFIRGAHSHLTDTNGDRLMSCQSCHGRMNDVGRVGREGWQDEPTCQSCHTGTIIHNNGAVRYTNSFTSPGVIRKAVDAIFATPPNVPAAGLSLYHASSGHGRIACAACHGPAHGEWPTSEPNEELPAIQLQGLRGMVTECTACHTTTPVSSAGGPHGMHPVDQLWAESHHDWIPDTDTHPECRVCHGLDDRGTVLSRARIDHTLTGRGTHHFWPGFRVGCYNCHTGPTTSGANTNAPPFARSLATNTLTGFPVSVTLQATNLRGTILGFRVVDAPAHGSVRLQSGVAAYLPAEGYFGADGFTYTASDGDNDSNLGSVDVSVAPGDCALELDTRVPLAASPGQPVPFRSDAILAGCPGSIVCEWDFGDGTPRSSSTNAVHSYALEGAYSWSLTVSAEGANQVASGTITISPTLGPPLTLTLLNYDFIYSLSWRFDGVPVSLETCTDAAQPPSSWYPVLESPFVDFDSVNTNVWVYRLPGVQFFRLRRVP